MTQNERMIYLDKLQEDGKKMGFIRMIPNIAKIPDKVFQEILDNPDFYFEVKNYIPMTEWEWDGQIILPDEFNTTSVNNISINNISINVFKLSTHIGDYFISSIGSLWTPGLAMPEGLRRDIFDTANFRNGITNLWNTLNTPKDRIVFDYETMVFKKYDKGDIDFTDLECYRSLDPEEIKAYHYLCCAYYSVLEKE